MRIHIGRISASLAENASDLDRMLSRFGKLETPISLHKKEFGDFYFAFADMDITKQEYIKLREKLNGVTFRQSKLEIQEARPKYTEIMETKPDPKPFNPDQLKRLQSYPPRRVGVYPGEFKRNMTVRSFPTYRIKIKGELKKHKLRKTKLWGIEKRPLEKLTHHFVDGEWRDAEDKAVEVVAQLNDEHTRDLKLAESIGTGYLSDSDFEDYKQNARELETVDDDGGIEVVPKDYQPDHSMGYNNEMEDDVYFEDNEVKTNDLDTLKSTFEVERPFTLFQTQPDQPAVAPIPQNDQQPTETEAPSGPRFGLFFAHKESPFLASQSQLSKLGQHFDSQAWETLFFEKRSEFRADLKKRRRDAVRMAKRMGKKRGE